MALYQCCDTVVDVPHELVDKLGLLEGVSPGPQLIPVNVEAACVRSLLTCVQQEVPPISQIGAAVRAADIMGVKQEIVQDLLKAMAKAMANAMRKPRVDEDVVLSMTYLNKDQLQYVMDMNSAKLYAQPFWVHRCDEHQKLVVVVSTNVITPGHNLLANVVSLYEDARMEVLDHDWKSDVMTAPPSPSTYYAEDHNARMYIRFVNHHPTTVMWLECSQCCLEQAQLVYAEIMHTAPVPTLVNHPTRRWSEAPILNDIVEWSNTQEIVEISPDKYDAWVEAVGFDCT